MLKEIRLFIVWPQGTTLPVRVPITETPSELAKMLSFANCIENKMILLYLNRMLDPDMSIISQGITDDTYLHVSFVPDETFCFDYPEDEIKSHDFIQEILRESQRVSDVRMIRIENQRRGYNAVEFLPSPNEYSDYSEHEDSVIVDTPQTISDTPLPKIWNNEQVMSFDADASSSFKFEFIGESGALFTKRRMDGWIW